MESVVSRLGDVHINLRKVYTRIGRGSYKLEGVNLGAVNSDKIKLGDVNWGW